MALRLAEDEIARLVRFPGLHNREIGHDAAFQHVKLAIEFLQLLAFGNKGADAGLGVETGNARAARAHAFRQRSLRAEFQLKLARQILALELLVLANIGTAHFPYLPRDRTRDVSGKS